MRRLLALWLLCATLSLAGTYDAVEIETAKTSIYVGSVTLKTSTLKREAARYTGTYDAKVFPFFFSSEKGTLFVDYTDEQLEALKRGERVNFTGGGQSSSGEDRHVEGHVTPDGPDSRTGKIKVRIFVSKKIQIIFNTTYQFLD